MANGDQFLAQGILQAGQAIGQGLQNRAAVLQQRKTQQQKLLQDKFNQFQKQRDSLLKVAGNESFPESVRQRSLNLANQFSSAIGQPLIGSEGEFGQAEKDFSKATATLIDLVEREKLPREQFNLLLREFRQAAVNQSQTPAERENIQELFTGAQEQVVGTGQFREFVQGGETFLGRPTRSGRIARAQTSQPVTLPPQRLAGETAGRAASAGQTLKDINRMRELLFPEGLESFDRTSLFLSKLPITKGKARELDTLASSMTETKLRLDTGATARLEEAQQQIKRFIPSPLDSPALAAKKLDDLETIMTEFIFSIDPQGKLQLLPANPQQNPSLRSQTSEKLSPATQKFLQKKGINRGRR